MLIIKVEFVGYDISVEFSIQSSKSLSRKTTCSLPRHNSHGLAKQLSLFYKTVQKQHMLLLTTFAFPMYNAININQYYIIEYIMDDGKYGDKNNNSKMFMFECIEI